MAKTEKGTWKRRKWYSKTSKVTYDVKKIISPKICHQNNVTKPLSKQNPGCAPDYNL